MKILKNWLNNRKVSNVISLVAVIGCALFAGADFAKGYWISGGIDIVLSVFNAVLIYKMQVLRDSLLDVYKELVDGYDSMFTKAIEK